MDNAVAFRFLRWIALYGLLFAVAIWCSGSADGAEPMPNAVRRERQIDANDQDKATIGLSAVDGKVATADLLAELGKVAGLNLRAIEWLLPDGQLELNEPKTQQRLTRINRVLGRYVQLHIVRNGGAEPELLAEIKREQWQTDKRRAKTRAKAASLKVLDPRGTLRAKQRYGLVIDEPAARGAGERLVVGIHGFNGGPNGTELFLEPLREAGHACASFVYPNDQPIADSAKLLSRELTALARRQPKRRVALVAFSMGGLVARAAIEDPRLDPGNVERLIMIATPNQGTICARYARGADLYEHIYRARRFEPRGLLVASMLDGLGEARKDLCPGSAFLQQLNARSRNKNVRYSILLGEGGELDVELAERVRSSIDKLERRSTLAQVLGPKLDRVRQDLQELTDPGDGFVTSERGRLAGVDDIEILRFGHAAPFGSPADEPVKSLHDAIAARLD
jgi:pimeloyl-ACP methyl ester carboxylesterase